MEKIINDLMNSICGIDENNKPKAMIGFSHEVWKVEDSSYSHPISTYSIQKPSIEMFIMAEKYLMVDMRFEYDIDIDLKQLWKKLSEYEDKKDEIYVKRFVFIPNEYKGYYMDCTFPIFYALQPTQPGGKNNTIRVLFELENVNIYYSDELDMNQIEKDVEQQIKQENELEEKRQAEKQKQIEIIENQINENIDVKL